MNSTIVICAGKMCVKYNSESAIQAVAESFRKEAGLLQDRHVEVVYGKCMRACRKGCVVTTQPDRKKYTKVTPNQARDIVTSGMEEAI